MSELTEGDTIKVGVSPFLFASQTHKNSRVCPTFRRRLPYALHVFVPFIWPDFLRYIDPVRLPLIFNMYESHLPALSFSLSLFTLPLSTAVTALAYWKSSSSQQKASQPSALTTLVAKVMGFVLFITILWAILLYIHIPQIEKHVPHQFIGGDFGWQSRLFTGVTALAIPTFIALFASWKGVMPEENQANPQFF